MSQFYTNEMGESILDPAGRPFKKAELTQEFATPRLTSVRSPWNPTVAAILTPERLAQLLIASSEGNDVDAYLTLSEEMEEREPHYASVLGTRKRAVAQLPVSVEAASDKPEDVKHADFIRTLTDRPEFEDLLIDSLDAIGKGWSIVEIMWNRSAKVAPLAGTCWAAVNYTWRDPHWFQWDQVTGEALLLRDEGNPAGLPLPRYKFVIHRPKLKSGLTMRGGVARLAAVSYMCKSFGLRDWMAFCEVFGMPLRVGKYGPNASETDVNILRRAVANIGTDAAAVIPDSMKIEFEQAVNAQGGAQLFEGLANWLDKQTSKAVLGQTMTTDDGSSLSQAKVHNDVRDDLRDYDARQLAKTLNAQWVRPHIDLNFGPQDDYPRIRIFQEEAEDLTPWINAVGEMVDRGAKVESSQVMDRLGIEDADENAEAEGRLLRPKNAAAPAPEPAATSEDEPALNATRIALNRQRIEDDLVEQLIDQASDDWQPQLEGMINPIERLISELLAAGGSLQDLLGRIDALELELDIDQLTHHLAAAMLKARAVGDATDDA